jgi:DMSO reductase family type II enzyme chaperone
MEQKRSNSAQNEAIDVALHRSTLYRWLSRAFRYPDADLAESLQPPALVALEATWSRLAPEGRDGLHPALTGLLAVSDDLALTELQSEYRRLFGHIESSPCPPYETRYHSHHLFQQTHQLADIAGFYRAFGLDISQEANERPDYLPIELEFLHFLCFKEAYAIQHHGTEHIELVRDAEMTFLKDHLLCWAPAFAGRLQEMSSDVFYANLGRLLRSFLAAEAARWGCNPETEVALQPIAFPPEGCNFSCGPDQQADENPICE